MNIEPLYASSDVFGNELSDTEREWCDENDIHATPFQKYNWKGASSRDTWRELLESSQSAKYEAEWRSILSDDTDRQAAIIHVNNYNREKWLKRVGEHGLSYRDIRYTEPYEGFSHKFFPTDKSDPERITYAVIAENDDIADKFEEAELEMDSHDRHDTVGGFLGFPECCRSFFNEKWVDDTKIDPMYEVSCNTDCAETIDGDRENLLLTDPNPWTNIMYRYFGWSFVTHIPCSWDCEESAEIGRTRGEIMADAGYTDASNALYNFLSEPMVWTGKNGIATVRNQHITGSAGTSSYASRKRVVWGEVHDAGGSIV